MLHSIRRACFLLFGTIFASEEPQPSPSEPTLHDRTEFQVVVGAAPTPEEGLGQELMLRPDSTLWLGEIEEELRALARRQTAQARRVARAKMVIGVVFEGRTIAEVARILDKTRATVRLWSRRFRERGSLEALEDLPRTGRPARLGTRAQAVVLGLACQQPKDIGRLEGRMTQPIIAEEAAKQGVVLSRSSVQRIMALAEVKPYRERYYLFTVKDRPEYIARRDAICAAYVREYPDDEILVCIDEKTGIQALGLPKKPLPHGGRRPAAPGLPALIE